MKCYMNVCAMLLHVCAMLTFGMKCYMKVICLAGEQAGSPALGSSLRRAGRLLRLAMLASMLAGRQKARSPWRASSAGGGNAAMEAAGWEVWRRGLGAAAAVNVTVAAVEEKDKDSESDGACSRRTPTRTRTEERRGCPARGPPMNSCTRGGKSVGTGVASRQRRAAGPGYITSRWICAMENAAHCQMEGIEEGTPMAVQLECVGRRHASAPRPARCQFWCCFSD
jgi:hypothetical protein